VTITVDSRLTEIGTEASAGIRDMLVRAVDGKPVAMYVEQEPLTWATVQSGGWDALGIPEADGGPGATLRDLAEIAKAWGEVIAPSPFIVSTMAKRFSPAAREHDGPISFAIVTRSSRPFAVVPFGDVAGTRVLTASDGAHVALENAAADDYAPSLRLAEGSVATEFTPDAARELAIVWAAEAAGCAKRMLDTAVAYAKERKQFDQPIGKFQVIKHYLANAQMLTELAETAVIVACSDPLRVRSATSYAFDSALKVAETAVQVHGGLGFTWEMGLHMYLRHINALRELTLALDL
jgi:alkylation response protein AidB-like acyl-CoA dehydrogenase